MVEKLSRLSLGTGHQSRAAHLPSGNPASWSRMWDVFSGVEKWYGLSGYFLVPAQAVSRQTQSTCAGTGSRTGIVLHRGMIEEVGTEPKGCEHHQRKASHDAAMLSMHLEHFCRSVPPRQCSACMDECSVEICDNGKHISEMRYCHDIRGLGA